MNSKQYYYLNSHGQEEGPLPLDVLKDWVRLGQLPPDADIRAEGSPTWTSIRDLAHHRAAATQEPGRVPEYHATPKHEGMPKFRLIAVAAFALLGFIVYQKTRHDAGAQAGSASPSQEQPAGATQAQTHALVAEGLNYLYGIGTKANLAEADRRFSEAMGQKDSCGAYWHIELFNSMNFGEIDKDTVAKIAEIAIPDCERLARQGDPLAQFCTGYIYCLRKDDNSRAEGLKLLAEVAKHGSAVAATEYADNLMKFGNADAQREAFSLLEKLVPPGNARATFLIGVCYMKGIGTSTDQEKGAELIQQAAEMQDYFALAVMEALRNGQH